MLKYGHTTFKDTTFKAGLIFSTIGKQGSRKYCNQDEIDLNLWLDMS